MTGHLGQIASALVDGQLPLAEQERALAHTAACPSCAREVAEIRAARALLSGSGQVPAPRAEFLSALALIASEPALHPVQPSAGSGLSPFLESEPLPGGDLAGVVRYQGDRRLPRLAAAVAVGALAVGAYVAGGPQSVRPDLSAQGIEDHLTRSDSMGDFVPVAGVGDVAVAGQVSGMDNEKVNAWLTEHGWSTIENLSAGVTIDRVGFSGPNREVLEIFIACDTGVIVLTQTHGQLDLETVRGLPTLEVEGAQYYVAGLRPTHLVWQSGHNVLEVSTQASTEGVQATINEFQVSPATVGVSDRMVRGLSQIAGALP